jgi:pyroglutamyl-peptidase
MAHPPRTTLLLTGFEPFGGESVNTSQQLALALDGERLGGLTVAAVVLPCRFASSLAALDVALRRHRPACVVALGQAASRQALSFERVAINWIDARIPDNDGAQPVDVPVLPQAAPAHFSTLPIKAQMAAAQTAGVPVEMSLSAGSFVCNQVFFGLQHRLRRQPAVRSGFIHVPALGEHADLTPWLLGLRAALGAWQADEPHPAAGRTD